MRNVKFWSNATVPPIWDLFLFGKFGKHKPSIRKVKNVTLWINSTVPQIWRMFLFGEALSPIKYQRKQ